jgi:hypothetical protein
MNGIARTLAARKLKRSPCADKALLDRAPLIAHHAQRVDSKVPTALAISRVWMRWWGIYIHNGLLI